MKQRLNSTFYTKLKNIVGSSKSGKKRSIFLTLFSTDLYYLKLTPSSISSEYGRKSEERIIKEEKECETM